VSSTNNPSSISRNTQIDWGPFKKCITNELVVSLVILPTLIILITLAGSWIKVGSLSQSDSNPPHLYMGDVLYLNDEKALTATLSSKLPFEIKTGEVQRQQVLSATQDFDNKYWLKKVVIRDGGFRVVSAKAPIAVEIARYRDGRSARYSFYSEKEGFPLNRTAAWDVFSTLIRLIMGFVSFFILFYRFVILPEERARRRWS
jgi:hypothetical protein